MRSKFSTIGIVIGLVLGLIMGGGIYSSVDSNIYCAKYPQRCEQGEMQGNNIFRWLDTHPFPIGGNVALIVMLTILPGLIGLAIDYRKTDSDTNKTPTI